MRPPCAKCGHKLANSAVQTANCPRCGARLEPSAPSAGRHEADLPALKPAAPEKRRRTLPPPEPPGAQSAAPAGPTPELDLPLPKRPSAPADAPSSPPERAAPAPVLNSLELELAEIASDLTDLPAPKGARATAAAMPSTSAAGDVLDLSDLPAPVGHAGRAGASPPAAFDLDLTDLPAPAGASSRADKGSPAAPRPGGAFELPADILLPGNESNRASKPSRPAKPAAPSVPHRPAPPPAPVPRAQPPSPAPPVPTPAPATDDLLDLIPVDAPATAHLIPVDAPATAHAPTTIAAPPAAAPAKLELDFGIELDAAPKPQPTSAVEPMSPTQAAIAAEISGPAPPRPPPPPPEAASMHMSHSGPVQISSASLERMRSGAVVVRAPERPSLRTIATRVLARARQHRIALAVGALVLASAGGTTVYLLTRPRTVPLAERAREMDAALRLLDEDRVTTTRQALGRLRALGDIDSPDAVRVRALTALTQLMLARHGTTGALAQAETLLARLPAGGPQDPEVLRARALAAFLKGNTTGAEQKLRSLLAAAPRDPRTHALLGGILIESDDADAAKATLARSLELDGKQLAARFGLGLVRERLGDRAAARESFAEVLKQQPLHLGAALGKLRNEAIDPTAATRATAQFLAKHGSIDEPMELARHWALLGLWGLALGQAEEGEHACGEALAASATNWLGRLCQARCELDQGRVGAASALARLEPLAAKQPRSRAVQLALLEAQVFAGQRDAALKTLASVTALAPKSAVVAYWRGRLAELAVPPDLDGARAAYQEAIAVDTRLVPAHLALAAVVRRQGQPAQADAMLAALEQRVAGDAALGDALGRGYLMQRDFARAAQVLRATVAAAPTLIGPRLHLAAALTQLRRLEEADTLLGMLTKEQGDLPGLVQHRAALALARHDYTGAAALFTAALRQGKPDLAVRQAAAEAYLKAGQIEAAKEQLTAVLQADEFSSVAHLGLAEINLSLGRFDDAAAAARQAIALGAGPRAQLLAALTAERRGHYEEALAGYQAAADDPSTEFEARLGRARLNIRFGAVKDAVAELNELLKKDDDRSEVYLLLGDCYETLGQPPQAHSAYQNAVRRDPKNAEAAFKLGRAHKDAGDRSAAIRELERAIQLSGERGVFSADAYLLLGDCYRETARLGQTDQRAAAVRAYRKYLELAPADVPTRSEARQRLKELESQ